MLKIINKNSSIKNYKKLILFIIISWIALWFSIDTHFELIQIKKLEIDINKLINITRVLFVFFTIFASTVVIFFFF